LRAVITPKAEAISTPRKIEEYGGHGFVLFARSRAFGKGAGVRGFRLTIGRVERDVAGDLPLPGAPFSSRRSLL